MRPLVIERLADSPPFVLGLSIIRGTATPVVHAALLLGLPESRSIEKFVTIQIGSRTAALAVGEVLGIRALPADTLRSLPPLLGDARSDLIQAIGTLDSGLLFVLRGARIVPDAVWAALDAHAVRA